jgi:hypothetical protein
MEVHMPNLSDYLQRIYSDIVGDLAKEIGDLFQSSEAKGSFNVTRFLEKVEHHLPTRYSFTTGTELFDPNGNHTKAKDFVIYDRTRNLFLSRKSDPTVLPVDTVHAVFEVKTTITKKELSRAIQQVQEVKKLHHLRRSIIQSEIINDRVCQTTRQTGPPIGGIVGYDTIWKNRETFEKNLLKASSRIPEVQRWDMLYVVNQAFLAVTQLLSGNQQGKYITYVNFQRDVPEPDVGAMFLNFLLALESRLYARSLAIPMIDFRAEYDLGEWLWHMQAKTFDESGNPIPRNEA